MQAKNNIDGVSNVLFCQLNLALGGNMIATLYYYSILYYIMQYYVIHLKWDISEIILTIGSVNFFFNMVNNWS